MDDQVLLEQAQGLVPVYVDGFGAFRKVNGVLRMVGFVLEGGAQLNLYVSLAGAMVSNRECTRVLRETPSHGLHNWTGLGAMAH